MPGPFFTGIPGISLTMPQYVLPGVARSRLTGMTLAGSMTPTGAVAKLPIKVFAATMTATGAYLRWITKFFNATMTPSGLAGRVIKTLIFAASMAPLGAVTQSPFRVVVAFTNVAAATFRVPRRAFNLAVRKLSS